MANETKRNAKLQIINSATDESALDAARRVFGVCVEVIEMTPRGRTMRRPGPAAIGIVMAKGMSFVAVGGA